MKTVIFVQSVLTHNVYSKNLFSILRMNCLTLSDYIAIAGVVVAIITLVVTIRIARIIPERDRLSHRKHIRDVVSRLVNEMKTGRNHMCKIIDIDRFETLYPDNFNSRNRQSHFKAELDDNDIHGVAFTNGILGVKEGKDGRLTVTKGDDETHRVARSGLIPYDWIIDIDESGDEIDTGAIFYCKFKKRKWRWGSYCVQQPDGSLKNKHGLYQDRQPFRSYNYYLITDDKTSYHQYVAVRGDKDAI